jgi:serine/threonine-protein kinase
VVIKVLPEQFAKDSDRVARFQREAKLLASLNHPNIAAIHGLKEADGTHFLVLELIEGDTLADRLKRGAIPVEESLKLALQIAEALEAAHEKGVIHRDLKPANIKVTPDGKVKVLDFGLAKAFAGDQEDRNLSNSPTLSLAATQQGIILGTAAYMSPEQARGESVDKKADIWAFGVVLFEMLTGRKIFDARTVSDSLAAVLMREPEWGGPPPNLHPRIRLLLERSLKKEPQNRYSGISDARVDIQEVLADPSGVFAQPVTAAKSRKKLRVGVPWLAAALVVGAVLAGTAIWMLKSTEPPHVVRFYHERPRDQQFSSLSERTIEVSPEGKQLAYCAIGGLYLRSVDELDARLIAGTEGAQKPFFSPDGQWIGYFSQSDGKLKKVAASGGAPVVIADASGLGFYKWDTDGTIVYGELGKGIVRISANGGTPEMIVGEDNTVPFSPQILPDGRSVIFTSFGTQGASNAIMAQSLESGERKELVNGDTARYLPTGHIVYAVDNDLFAIRFDPDKLETIGGPVSVVEGVFRVGGSPQYAVSDSGTLAYIPGTSAVAAQARTLVWVDRDGKEEPITAKPNIYLFPKISPDGRQVALAVGTLGNTDIWIWDLFRKNLIRLTFNEKRGDLSPLWTPDGKRVAFASNREGGMGIYWKTADGTGKVELLGSDFGGALGAIPSSWSVDGKRLVAMAVNLTGDVRYDIGALLMEGDREWRPLLKEDYVETEPQISPNGQWMAYTSDESGQAEIYVRAFPDVDSGKWQVSTAGGRSPLWSPDGWELFYRNGDAIMAVSVRTEPSFSAEAPKTLFRGTYLSLSDIRAPLILNSWDISPDSKGFLMIKPPIEAGSGSTSAGPSKIIVVLNWFEELKERVPTQ